MVRHSSRVFTDKDIIFMANEADSRLLGKVDIIKNDPAIIDSILENKSRDLLRRIMLMSTDSMLVTISPRLLFEVLLRSARQEMATHSYTIERTGLEKIPVFDADEANDFIKDSNILTYLADMLSSFVRIRSYVWPIRVRKGIWRRVRFNDIDIDSLLRFCDMVNEERRYDLYKRIGDLCLFILGVFPEYLPTGNHYSASGESRPVFLRRRAYTAEYYEETGRKFYALASEHQDSRVIGLDDIFSQLNRKFNMAKKPLNYISEHYLQFRRGELFPSGTSD